jgi:ATP-binding cassette subfamily C (CFTR/MRP) protein 1
VVTNCIGERQRNWAAATEQRLSITSSVLGGIKGVKMMGLSEKASEMLQHERVKETKQMEKLHWIIVWKNVIGKKHLKIHGISILLNHAQPICPSY